VELEHLKTKTRLKDEKFASVKGLDGIGDPSRLRLIRKTTALSRIFPTLDLNIEEKAARR
jgi:hypothetical protein